MRDTDLEGRYRTASLNTRDVPLELCGRLGRRYRWREGYAEKGIGAVRHERGARRTGAKDPRNHDEGGHHERDPRPGGVGRVRDFGTPAAVTVAGGIQLRVEGDERRHQQREQQVRNANLNSHNSTIVHARISMPRTRPRSWRSPGTATPRTPPATSLSPLLPEFLPEKAVDVAEMEAKLAAYLTQFGSLFGGEEKAHEALATGRPGMGARRRGRAVPGKRIILGRALRGYGLRHGAHRRTGETSRPSRLLRARGQREVGGDPSGHVRFSRARSQGRMTRWRSKTGGGTLVPESMSWICPRWCVWWLKKCGSRMPTGSSRVLPSLFS